MVDAGLDLGKTRAAVARAAPGPRPAGRSSATRSSCRRRTSGSSATSSAPMSTDRREASHAAHALGIALGCRILRAHDVRGARRVADVMAAVLEARAGEVASACSTVPVDLVKGGDEVVLRDAVRLLVDELVGDEDHVARGRGGGGRQHRRRRAGPSGHRSSTPPRRRRSSPSSGWCSAGSPTSGRRPSSCSRSSTTSSTRSPPLGWCSTGGADGVPKTLLEAITPRRRRAGRHQSRRQDGRVGRRAAQRGGPEGGPGRPIAARRVGGRRAEPPPRADRPAALHLRRGRPARGDRDRAVPRRRRRRAAVGPHRRHRPGRPADRARAPAAHDRAGRAPPLPGAGHAAHALRPDAATRRRRACRARRTRPSCSG